MDLPEDDPIRRRPDIKLAKDKINWEPKISIKEGMRRVYDAVIVREKKLGNL